MPGIPGKANAGFEVSLGGIAEKGIAQVRCSVGKISEHRKLSGGFRGNGCHLITEPKIQSKVRFPAPVVLYITANESLAKVTRRKSTGNSSLKMAGLICVEGLQIVEIKNSIR